MQRSLGLTQRHRGHNCNWTKTVHTPQMMGLGPPPRARGPDGPSTAELLARTSQANMADLNMRRHRFRWLGHAARKPNDVMVKHLLFAHFIPGHPRPIGRPHLTWMDTAMHDMGSLS